jgi:hypothetical protein
MAAEIFGVPYSKIDPSTTPGDQIFYPKYFDPSTPSTGSGTKKSGTGFMANYL